jgi:hypothetical protein
VLIVPVIMSGGAGTRLWPVSREGHPKPFMRLPDGESLLGKAYMGYIARRLQTDFNTVQRAVSTARTQSTTPEAGKQAAPATKPAAPLTVEQKAEMELARVAAISPGVRAGARDLLNEGAVADETAKRLIGAIAEAGTAVGDDLYAAVARTDGEAAELVSGWLVDAREVEPVEYAFREVAARVKEFALGRLIFTKKAGLQAIDAKQDPETFDRLFSEIAELQRSQQALRTRQPDSDDVEMEQS